MLEIKTLKKIDYHIAIWGLIAIALALPIGGIISLFSAVAGAVLGIMNWMIFRVLAGKLVQSGDRLALSLFLAVKYILLIAAISLLLLFTPIQPISFAAGITSLFLGISTAYIFDAIKDNKVELRGEK